MNDVKNTAGVVGCSRLVSSLLWSQLRTKFAILTDFPLDSIIHAGEFFKDTVEAELHRLGMVGI